MTKLEADYLRTTAVWYLKRFIGLPYRWGGDDPIEGFDCSGLVHEVLQGVGKEQRGLDSTAENLYLSHKSNTVDKGYAGCFVFWYIQWQGEERIAHVEMMIDDKFCIGASGGGSKVNSLDDAVRENAFIKMNPINYRGGQYYICDPFMVKGIR